MQKLNVFSLALSLFVLVVVTSCGNDDDTNASTDTFNLSVNGLEDLGADYVYEGWIIVNGSPVSTGVFTVDANGTPSQTAFDVPSDELDEATAFVISIEPTVDNDPAPSAVKILGGDFSGNTSNLSTSHGAALATDFASAAGSYILATPTNDIDTDELSGVWWLDPMAGPGPGLTLPTLPEGWAYEGWAVINGTPVSTGTFTSVSGADEAAPFSGPNSGPAYPGEDFLTNSPDGLTFPTDLTSATVVISVEPVPDNSEAPFALKPLVGNVPAGALDHTLYDMDNNASATNPTGTVTR